MKEYNEENLASTMIDLSKTLDGLKNKREAVIRDINDKKELRNQLQEQLNILSEQLEGVTSQLEQQKTVLNVYDKILNESDSAYNKIVQSTQALYNMVKSEENKMNFQGK